MKMEKSIDEIIDLLGVGKFTWFIVFVSGICYMSDASELNLISLIAPQLRCVWNLASLETSFTSFSLFLGQPLGYFFWGFIGDKYGRKKAAVTGTIMLIFFGLMNAAVTSFGWFLAIRFLVGFGLGSSASALCLISEYVPSSQRGKLVSGQVIFYAFGSIYACLIALALMQFSWRYFLLASTIPALIFIILSFWLPESVRYLQNVNEFDKMYKILHRISLSHNAPLPSINDDEVKKDEQGNVQVLMQKEYRSKIVLMAIIFVSSYYAYYGAVMMNTEFLQLEGNSCWNNIQNKTFVPKEKHKCHELNTSDYVQNIYITLAEFPGSVILILVVDIIGRKAFIVPGLFIIAMCFIAMNICLTAKQMSVLMFFIRMFAVAVSQVPILLSAELFPTIVRASAMGLLIGITKLSLIGVSFLVQGLMRTSLLLTTGTLAGLCIMSGILAMFLPETKRKPLESS